MRQALLLNVPLNVQAEHHYSCQNFLGLMAGGRCGAISVLDRMLLQCRGQLLSGVEVELSNTMADSAAGFF
jgi:hypothetical protein